MEQTEPLHGVMVCINNQGLLITGAPGIGKSSLALELLSQGHQLIADDVIDVCVKNHQLFGKCPPMLSGLLHCRELGLIDIEHQFGKNAYKPAAYITLHVHLSNKVPPHHINLDGNTQSYSLLGQQIPSITLSLSNPASISCRLLTWIHQQTHSVLASKKLHYRQLKQMRSDSTDKMDY